MIDGLSLRCLPQLASGEQRGANIDSEGVIPAMVGMTVSQREGWREEESKGGREVV